MDHKFPKIGQFRQTVRAVQHKSQFQGLDSAGNPVFDRTASYPTLSAKGTVKIHGTNAGVRMLPDGSIQALSRTRVLSLLRDNHGFAAFVQARESHFTRHMSPGATLWGEWCGRGIQKGVGVSEVDPLFVVFYTHIIDGKDKWLPFGDDPLVNPSLRIHSINDFPTYSVTIDFDNPGPAQNRMVEITSQVEKECPVAREFGVSGVGEGVVWHIADEGYLDQPEFWWKVKGEKHSSSKVKTTAAVDPEKLANAEAFVDATVTENRCLQGIEHLKLEGKPLDKSSTGTFLQWLFSDIVKEEFDVLEASGLTPKDVSKLCQTKGRVWLFNFLDNV